MINVLISAAELGDIESIRQMISYGVDVDVKDPAGRTALLVAARYGQHSVAEFLLVHGAGT